MLRLLPKLAGKEAALWLAAESLTVEHAGEPLSRYAVKVEATTGELRSVARPRLFGPRLFGNSHGLRRPQRRLFALDALGEGGWLKAMRLEGYAPRAPRRARHLQQTLFPLRGSPLKPMRDSLGRTRRRVLVILLALAVLGHAHWFFGNLYEAVVLIPQFAAAPEQRLPISAGGVLVPGSPALYYVPVVPLTAPAALAALAVGWRFGRVVRGELLGAAALSVSAALLGAYIVTRLNFPLFFEAGTGAARLEDLLGRWALLNHARVGLVGAALVLLLLSLISATRSARTPSARDGVQ